MTPCRRYCAGDRTWFFFYSNEAKELIHLSPSTVFETHREITKCQSLLRDPSQTLEELADPEWRKVLV